MLQQYLLTEEEKCALIDIVRFHSADAVNDTFRNELLLKLALVAVSTLYQDLPLPMPEDLDNFVSPQTDPMDFELAVTFSLLKPLPTKKQLLITIAK